MGKEINIIIVSKLAAIVEEVELTDDLLQDIKMTRKKHQHVIKRLNKIKRLAVEVNDFISDTNNKVEKK